MVHNYINFHQGIHRDILEVIIMLFIMSRNINEEILIDWQSNYRLNKNLRKKYIVHLLFQLHIIFIVIKLHTKYKKLKYLQVHL